MPSARICELRESEREMRLFIAVDLSEEAREAIAAEQKRIAAALGGTKTSLQVGHSRSTRI